MSLYSDYFLKTFAEILRKRAGATSAASEACVSAPVDVQELWGSVLAEPMGAKENEWFEALCEMYEGAVSRYESCEDKIEFFRSFYETLSFDDGDVVNVDGISENYCLGNDGYAEYERQFKVPSVAPVVESDLAFSHELGRADIDLTSCDVVKLIKPACINALIPSCALPELLILGIGILKNVSRGASSYGHSLINLQYKYLHLDFEGARDSILRLLKHAHASSANFPQVSSGWVKCINSMIDRLEHFSGLVISDNKERRYFESLFSQRFLTEFNDGHLNFLRSHVQYPLEGDSLSEMVCMRLESMECMQDKPRDYRALKLGVEGFWERPITSARKRQLARSFKVSEKMLETFSPRDSAKRDVVDCRSPGVMKASTPRPAYLYSEHPVYRTQAAKSDLKSGFFRCSFNGQGRLEWEVDNLHTPYVSGPSGHLIELVGALLFFLKEEVPRELRRSYTAIMFEACISSYVSQGFHSLAECMDTLFSSAIQADLKLHDADLKMDDLFRGDAVVRIIDRCFDDTLAYTMRQVNARRVQQSIRLVGGVKSRVNSVNKVDLAPMEGRGGINTDLMDLYRIYSQLLGKRKYRHVETHMPALCLEESEPLEADQADGWVNFLVVDYFKNMVKLASGVRVGDAKPGLFAKANSYNVARDAVVDFAKKKGVPPSVTRGYLKDIFMSSGDHSRQDGIISQMQQVLITADTYIPPISRLR